MHYYLYTPENPVSSAPANLELRAETPEELQIERFGLIEEGISNFTRYDNADEQEKRELEMRYPDIFPITADEVERLIAADARSLPVDITRKVIGYGTDTAIIDTSTGLGIADYDVLNGSFRPYTEQSEVLDNYLFDCDGTDAVEALTGSENTGELTDVAWQHELVTDDEGNFILNNPGQTTYSLGRLSDDGEFVPVMSVFGVNHPTLKAVLAARAARTS